MKTRPARAGDREAILSVECACFPDDSWTAEDFGADPCLVAEIRGKIVGFLVSRQTYPGDETTLAEREILNLAVLPAFRSRGIASALLKRELTHPAEYFLEVRESNIAARRLYMKLGFTEVARRTDYYESPPETAIVMRMKKC